MTKPSSFCRSLPRFLARISLAVAMSTSVLCLSAGAQVIPLSGEFQANQDTMVCAINPKVFARPDGGFGVVWGDQSVQGIRARIYDADGVPETNELTIVPESGVLFHDAAQMPDGGFVTIWSEFPGKLADPETPEGSGADQQVFGRRFAADGTAMGSEFDVSALAHDISHASLAVDDLGEFVVAWRENDMSTLKIEARRFASDGSTLGSQFTVESAVSAEGPDVAKQADSGEFTVVWYDDGPDLDIHARSFSASGTPMGAEFVVNSYTSGAHRSPVVALSTLGDMLVSWSGPTSTSGGESRVVLAAFDESGTPGGEVPVGSSTTVQDLPALAASADLGSFVMGWSDLTDVPGEGSLTSDPRGAFNLYFDQQLTSTEAGEQDSLAVALDPAERATVVWLTDPDENFCSDVVGIRGQLFRMLAEGDTDGAVYSATQQVAWKYFFFDPPAAGNYEIKLSNLTGDADLYVQTGALPESSLFSCRPFLGGTQEESCIVGFTGTPFGIGVNGFQVGTTEFTLSVGPVPPIFADGFESGDTSAWTSTVN